MPTVNLPQTGFDSQEEIADGLIATNRTLTYLLYNLEDQNIKNLSADKITAGTIDATEIDVINLDADNITAGTIDASQITVDNINASNISTGTLNAIDIQACDITGVNIIGSRFYDDDEDGYFELLGGSATDFRLVNGSGSTVFKVYDTLTGAEFSVGTVNFLSNELGDTYPRGNWDFSLATVSGLTATFA